MRLPIHTPKEIIEANRIMRNVKEGTAPMRAVKQRRYKAYLQHSQIGYFPNGKGNTLLKKIKDIFYQIKDEFTFDEFV